MPKLRIKPGDSIKKKLEEYPCLKTLLMDGSEIGISSDKVNKIMGQDFVKWNQTVTAKMINAVLDKLLEGE